jgi:hypothetical protein
MMHEFRRAKRRKASDTILVTDVMTERVIGLNHDRRRRTTSPCWLVTNSIQVPNGITLSCS